MILSFHDLSIFALAALAMVLTPGPNMVYLVSRSLCQGTRAAMVSLVGVLLGFLLHMLVAAAGLSVFFVAVPVAYHALKYAGAAYLLWLAWQAVRPGARGLFEPRVLPPDSTGKLVWMGFLTNSLNPKIAVFYVSIFTQFLDPARGPVWTQSLVLGFTQIAISCLVNTLIIHAAGWIAGWFREKPSWARVQRWFMASVLGGLAVKLALSDRK
ncbi:MAG: lysine transporter LysE [Rariglobus sp.]|jgi:threonine/homoserine/homoserine lactone efflux protein|nr:lysine transporter LysE [Rariglobus sp.]